MRCESGEREGYALPSKNIIPFVFHIIISNYINLFEDLRCTNNPYIQIRCVLFNLLFHRVNFVASSENI